MQRLLCAVAVPLLIVAPLRADVATDILGTRLSLGAEARESYERYAQGTYAFAPDNANGYWLQRYLLHAEARLTPDFRIYGELQSALQKFRNGGARPTDADNLDVEELYAEGTWREMDEAALTGKAGRQEMFFGSGRFVANRDLPGARQAFDGARFTQKIFGTDVDLFGARPVVTSPGSFDNHADANQSFWGVYGTRRIGDGGAHADLYYLGLRRDDAVYAVGPGRETRDMPGFRVWGKSGAADYDVEADYQLGNFNAKRIQAWSVANEFGLSFADAAWRPRPFTRFGAISGNSDPHGSTLGTFWPYFPRGELLDFSGLIGPQNLLAFEAGTDLHPFAALQFIVAADWYWRESPNDGVYDLPGVLAAGPNARRTLFVGSEPEFKAVWTITPHVESSFEYSHFFPGGFLRESGLTREIDYLAERVTFKF